MPKNPSTQGVIACSISARAVLTLQACVTRGFGHKRLVKGMLKGVAAAENMAGINSISVNNGSIE